MLDTLNKELQYWKDELMEATEDGNERDILCAEMKIAYYEREIEIKRLKGKLETREALSEKINLENTQDALHLSNLKITTREG